MNILMELLIVVTLVALVLFGILFTLSITPRLEKSKVFLLPIICGGLLLGWTIWSTLFYWGQVEKSNFNNMSRDFFITILSLVGLPACVSGIITGLLLHFGSLLWGRKNIFDAGAMIFFSLILWLISIPVIFYVLGLWATG